MNSACMRRRSTLARTDASTNWVSVSPSASTPSTSARKSGSTLIDGMVLVFIEAVYRNCATRHTHLRHWATGDCGVSVRRARVLQVAQSPPIESPCKPIVRSSWKRTDGTAMRATWRHSSSMKVRRQPSRARNSAVRFCPSGASMAGRGDSDRGRASPLPPGVPAESNPAPIAPCPVRISPFAVRSPWPTLCAKSAQSDRCANAIPGRNSRHATPPTICAA